MRLQAIALSRRRQAGFNLTELFVVLLIVGVLGAVGMQSTTRGPSSWAFTQELYALMLQAREEALGDGFQRRLLCSATACRYQIAATVGLAPPAAWTDISTVAAGSQAQMWALQQGTLAGTTAPSGPLSTAQDVRFLPDGSATAATVFVCDRLQHNRYKIYVYGATGMPRQVDTW